MRLPKLLLVLVVCAAAPAVAGPLEDAAVAHMKGDYATALYLLRSLAAQGDAEAQGFLGLMYQSGDGVLQNDAAAASWYRKSAEQGDTISQNNLGSMYEFGVGVPQDYVQAHMWFNLAASRFAASKKEQRAHALAIENRDIVVKKMTSAQIAEAQKLAREWKPTPPVASPTPSPVSAPTPHSSSTAEVPMKKEGGTYVVPVLINNALKLDFTVDSGAADVSIPEDVVSTLIRTGTIRDTDFIGEKTYVLADGSRVKQRPFVFDH